MKTYHGLKSDYKTMIRPADQIPIDYEKEQVPDWNGIARQEVFEICAAGLVVFGLCVLALLWWTAPVQADAIPASQAVKALIGEFEGEGYDAMKAGACALRSRGTLSGVYGLRAPRVIKHLYSDDIEARAVVAWATSADPGACDYMKGADHWGSLTVDGAWIQRMKRAGYVHIITVKNTAFYRAPTYRAPGKGGQ